MRTVGVRFGEEEWWPVALCRRPRFGLCHAWKNVQCFSRTKGMVDERIG